MLNVKVEKIKELTGHKEAIYSLAKINETTFLSGAGDGWVVKWDLQKEHGKEGQLIARLPGSNYALNYLPEANQVVAGHNQKRLHLLDLSTNRQILERELPEEVFDVAVDRKHQLAIAACGKGWLQWYKLPGWTLLNMIQPCRLNVRKLALNPVRALMAAGFSDHYIRLYDVLNGEEVAAWNAHANSVFALNYNLDGDKLFSGGRDAMLRLWQLGQYDHPEIEVPAHLYTINRSALHPSGAFLATASRDKTVKIWQASDLKLLKVIDHEKVGAHFHSVNNVLWLTDELLVSAGDDKRILVWKINFEPA